ncbi:putative secreted protein (Por secretion system target) [Lutibacter sp. Hel_I_33_5]|uniref:T9SS type A sorting domain-containing protein n=1 Tax=Lutibacter sp. Hel_I_33_5 TaxID=1566289 RepID=UPI0011A5AA85|nr:T9SS type A sorting domain-containing protein [Lutibacter sp. Hel_I_33_5]TVZ56379.1 putative secreted protein (Por secretion system target) [Lutibacter sp. Hel_I_33_5]
MKNKFLLITILSCILSCSQKNKNIEKEDGYSVFKKQKKSKKGSKKKKHIASRFIEKSSKKSIQETAAIFQKYQKEILESNTSFQGTWEELGPTYYNDETPKIGRVTSIAAEKGNSNHIIIGSETGGVWKTVDGGTKWTVLTDNQPSLDVFSLAIDPSNAQKYYWGSKEGTLYVSSDAGSTWSLLADVSDREDNNGVNKILIHPTNSNILYCSSQDEGIFRSTDSGATWTKIHQGSLAGFDIEFKPGDPNIVYATGNHLFISRDNGVTFNKSTLLPNPVSSQGHPNARMIGVTPANSNVIYIVENNSDHSGFGALYKSIDAGVSFIKIDDKGKDYIGDSFDGGGEGQSPDHMDIAIDPANENIIHIAGIYINYMVINNNAVTLPLTRPQNQGNLHVDFTIMKFIDNKLYVGTDGGIQIIDKPNDLSASNKYLNDISTGLGILQVYKLGISQTDPVNVIEGAQDNGTLMYVGSTKKWKFVGGGDGMECFFDKTDPSIIYYSAQAGALFRITADDEKSISPQGAGVGAWTTPFEQDLTSPNTIYSGYKQVYKSTDKGDSWTAISQTFNFELINLKIAPSNNKIMYCNPWFGELYKTDDGGATEWKKITSIPLTRSVFGTYPAINTIAIHPTNPLKVAVAASGIGAPEKVYLTNDGGVTWSSIKHNLPDFEVDALEWDKTAENGLYLGMNYGVFYINDTFIANNKYWQPFSNNLPNVRISELEINYADNKLYTATYGRGIWRSDLFDSSLATDKYKFSGLKLYPNPVRNNFNLTWNNTEKVAVSIFDASGKLISFNKDISLNNSFKVDTRNYSKGIYFVKVNNAKGMTVKKIIVE